MAITINIFLFQLEFALLLCRKGTTTLFDTYTLENRNNWFYNIIDFCT